MNYYTNYVSVDEYFNGTLKEEIAVWSTDNQPQEVEAMLSEGFWEDSEGIWGNIGAIYYPHEDDLLEE